jgi:hypothetical protein
MLEGAHLFLKLPTTVLLHLLEFAGKYDALSSFGSTCRQLSDHYDLFNDLYLKASGRLKVQRSLRSATLPRVAYFSLIKTSLSNAINRLQLAGRTVINKGDSLISLKRVIGGQDHPRYKLILGELAIHSVYNFQFSVGSATALCVAAWRGNLKLVKWLVGMGADKSIPGVLTHTSACGGFGPYTPAEWALRKATALSDLPSYAACAAFLKD